MFNKNLTLAALLFSLVGFNAFSSSQIETDEYKDVAAKAYELVKTYGKDNVLIAFDIDNTILKTDHDLGSEPWFNWQAQGITERDQDTRTESEKEKDPKYNYLVATKFPELVRIWSLCLYLGTATVTQPDFPKILAQIQSLGAATIIMTARGPGDHDHTLRELRRNYLVFDNSAMKVKGKDGILSMYYPYDYANPKASGFTDEEIAKYKLTTVPKPVQYNEGVYLTEGQNKGVMLRALLAKAKKEYKAILFIDNDAKNTTRVQDLFANQTADGKPVDVVTVRYSRQDKSVAEFMAKDKKKVIQEWQVLATTLYSIFHH